MTAAKGMEASTRFRRLEGRPGEAIPPKSCRGRTLRKIVALKTCGCRTAIGLLRNTIGCTRPAAIEARTIPRTGVLLRGINRRLHVVVSLLLYRAGVANSGRLVTPVIAFAWPAT